MSALESLCFLRILPLLIGDKVNESDQYWELPTLLILIVDMVFAKDLSKSAESALYKSNKKFLPRARGT